MEFEECFDFKRPALLMLLLSAGQRDAGGGKKGSGHLGSAAGRPASLLIVRSNGQLSLDSSQAFVYNGWEKIRDAIGEHGKAQGDSSSTGSYLQELTFSMKVGAFFAQETFGLWGSEILFRFTLGGPRDRNDIHRRSKSEVYVLIILA